MDNSSPSIRSDFSPEEDMLILRTNANNGISFFRLTNDAVYQFYRRRLNNEDEENFEFVKRFKYKFAQAGKAIYKVLEPTICCLLAKKPRNSRANDKKRSNVLKTVRI